VKPVPTFRIIVSAFSLVTVATLLTSPCQATPVVDSTQAVAQATSLTLLPGSQLYLFGAVNGGSFTTSLLAEGQPVSVTDAVPGVVAAQLAATTVNSNSYTTSSQFNVFGGLGVSQFNYAQGFYGDNPGPGAHSASVQFTLTAPALVVLLGEASSQQELTFSGLTNLVIDVPYTTSVALSIAHAYLGPGTYTAQETSLDTAAGQDPNHMVDLLGVLILSDQPNASTSSNPQIPLPASSLCSGPASVGPSPANSPWAGYVVGVRDATGTSTFQNYAVTDVKGSWTVPVAYPVPSLDSAYSVWVGIGGFYGGIFGNNSNLVQIGTAVQWPDPVPFAWYQVIDHISGGQPFTPLLLPVLPGDTISAEILNIGSYLGQNIYQLTIKDVSLFHAPISDTFTVSSSANQQNTGEWIVENQDNTCPFPPCEPLSDFGVVNFNDCSVALNFVPYSINGDCKAEDVKLSMDEGGEAQPSDLSPDGTSFSVTFNAESLKLSGVNLKNVDLQGAYLQDASLAGANLQGANLADALLQGANLAGANLKDADLQGASLQGANLTGANLNLANLSGADLTGANLSVANLHGADLQNANFTNANLSGANLNGANTTGAIFTGAVIKGCNGCP